MALASLLHNQVKDKLLERIRKGIYKPGDRLPSQKILAREYNVSFGTISRAVSELCAEGLLESRSRSGVRVLSASNLRLKAGILYRHVFHQKNHPYLQSYEEIRRILAEINCEITLTNVTQQNGDRPPGFIPADRMYGQALMGLFVVNIFDITYLWELRNLSAPVIVLDRDTQQVGLDCVVLDNIATSYAMTQYLIEQGHTAIAFFGLALPVSHSGQRDYDPATEERYTGYRLAMLAHGLCPRPEWEVHCSRPLTILDQAELFLRNQPEVTATVAECGISDPEDGLLLAMRRQNRTLDIAGWEYWGVLNEAYRDHLVVITSFDLSLLGRAAANLLVEKHQSQDWEPRRILLPGTVTTRDGKLVEMARPRR